MKYLNIKIAEQTLKLLIVYDWKNISIDMICKKLKIDKKKTIKEINNKHELLKIINEYFDNKILLSMKSIDLSTPRDMIFEIIMLRFDYLNEYRLSIKKIFNFFKSYPKFFILLLPSFLRSVNFMAKSANIETNGIIGRIKIKALLIIYFSTFLTWVKDENPSLDKTMTILDEYLERSEKVLKIINK